MKYLSCSSYISHHAKGLTDAMYQQLGADYTRVATREMPEERKQLGYQEFHNIPYQKQLLREDIREFKTLCDDSDIIEL